MWKEEEHTPLQLEADDRSEKFGTDTNPQRRFSYLGAKRRAGLFSRFWIHAVIALLLTLNIVQVALSRLDRRDWGVEKPERMAKQMELPRVYRRFWWNTLYSDHNWARQNEMWANIRWSQGMIAVDKQWAETQDWPQTMNHPKDPSKGVWLLGGYHEVHCLWVIRTHFDEGFGGSPPAADDWGSRAHISHCFDHLLQAIICNADSTPLTVPGGPMVGQRQVHRCRDWSLMHDFANKHSACYTMNNTLPYMDAFDECRDSDGLEWGLPKEPGAI